MKTYLNITGEEADRLAAATAPIIAEVFRAEGWFMKGVDGTPSEDNFKQTILEILADANTVMPPYFPEVRRGAIKVEVLPDLKVAQVWLRVGEIATAGNE